MMKNDFVGKFATVLTELLGKLAEKVDYFKVAQVLRLLVSCELTNDTITKINEYILPLGKKILNFFLFHNHF